MPASLLTHCQICRVRPASTKITRCSKASLATCRSYLAPRRVGRDGAIGAGATDVDDKPGLLRGRFKGVVVTINVDADRLGAVVVPTKTLYQQVLEVKCLQIGAKFINLYLHQLRFPFSCNRDVRNRHDCNTLKWRKVVPVLCDLMWRCHVLPSWQLCWRRAGACHAGCELWPVGADAETLLRSRHTV